MGLGFIVYNVIELYSDATLAGKLRYPILICQNINKKYKTDNRKRDLISDRVKLIQKLSDYSLHPGLKRGLIRKEL